VRGIESLCILKDIMTEVASEEAKCSGDNIVEPQDSQQENGKTNKHLKSYDNEPPPCAKPCGYFDLICGTSTGGLIALMLGRLKHVSHRQSVILIALTCVRQSTKQLWRVRISQPGFSPQNLAVLRSDTMTVSSKSAS
jgi:hypothetical protein